MSDTDTVTVVMAEYNTLRTEILKRIELMHQVTSLGLVVPGTIFAFGFQTQDANIILLYPILSLILSLLWSENDRRSRECGHYIHTQIESKFAMAMGWESFMDSARDTHKLFDRDAVWAAVGTFAGTGVLAIVVGVPIALKFGTILPLWLLLSAGIVAIAFTIIKLLRPYKHQKRIKHFSDAFHKNKIIKL